ncbi:MAG TPA: galactokinase, partial [Candidatus Binatia bacterium]|nr:galactokinase [Candidatus Binatia bacterium]
TAVAIARAGGNLFTLYAAELNRTAQFTAERPPQEHFATYVYGCIRELQDRGILVPPVNIHVASDVPIGVGLSSSAALEVACLRALLELLGRSLDDVSIAEIAQQAEIKYAGVNCGIMDQMASSLGDTGSMIFLDTRTLERKLLPLPASSEVLVLDSGVARTLAGSKYNERRAECEQAARFLGVKALRDVAELAATEQLPEPLQRRARHVMTENSRVLQACGRLAAGDFGRLMNESHQSLRDDYEVSIPALDHLVGLLQKQPAVYGARLTGAGFGGACVALCRSGEARKIGRETLAGYNDAGGHGRLLVPPDTTLSI